MFMLTTFLKLNELLFAIVVAVVAHVVCVVHSDSDSDTHTERARQLGREGDGKKEKERQSARRKHVECFVANNFAQSSRLNDLNTC